MHASANQPVRYSISIASIPHATASRRLIITEMVMRFVIRRLVANGMQQLLDCARSAGRRRLDDRSHHGTGWSRHLTSVHPYRRRRGRRCHRLRRANTDPLGWYLEFDSHEERAMNG